MLNRRTIHSEGSVQEANQPSYDTSSPDHGYNNYSGFMCIRRVACTCMHCFGAAIYRSLYGPFACSLLMN